MRAQSQPLIETHAAAVKAGWVVSEKSGCLWPTETTLKERPAWAMDLIKTNIDALEKGKKSDWVDLGSDGQLTLKTGTDAPQCVKQSLDLAAQEELDKEVRGEEAEERAEEIERERKKKEEEEEEEEAARKARRSGSDADTNAGAGISDMSPERALATAQRFTMDYGAGGRGWSESAGSRASGFYPSNTTSFQTESGVIVHVRAAGLHRSATLELPPHHSQQAQDDFDRARTAGKSYAGDSYNFFTHNCVGGVAATLKALGVKLDVTDSVSPWSLDRSVDRHAKANPAPTPTPAPAPVPAPTPAPKPPAPASSDGQAHDLTGEAANLAEKDNFTAPTPDPTRTTPS